MFQNESFPNIEYETTTYLQRRFLNSPLGARDKRYKGLWDKLQTSYDRLEPIFLEIEEKYQEVLEILTFRLSDSSSTLLHMMFIVSYLHNSNTSSKDIFLSQLYSNLTVDETFFFHSMYVPSEQELIDVLISTDIDKKEKWNIILVCNEFETYYQSFLSILKELKLPIERELGNYKSELQHFHDDWQHIIDAGTIDGYLKKKMHVDLLVDDNTSFQICPSIFGSNSFTWSEHLLFVGIIFDSEFEFHDELTIENLARTFKIFSDTSKLTIIKELLQTPMYGKELADTLDLTPATISYHMSDLASNGLVRFVQGKNKRVYYHINEEFIEEILHAFENLIKK